MATYILFWNPEISSYTKKRFLEDVYRENSVGNWSFYEHEDVSEGDRFYMVRCGKGRTGIVMYGEITSDCYESEDWSPKRRKHIFYADINPYFWINPWLDSPMLTPEVLTEALPGFDWFGGHSGRRLPDDLVEKLDELWFNYLDENKKMFSEGEATYHSYYTDNFLPEDIKQKITDKADSRCEFCGYSYIETFGEHPDDKDFPSMSPMLINSPLLKRLFYCMCDNCKHVPYEYLAQKING